MKTEIGAAPCSWGVEFAGDPRNPHWERVLDECAEAGYGGIELGPVGYMPEDPAQLGDALAARDLTLIAGVAFRAFHDPLAWDDVRDGVERTAAALAAHGAEHLVLIDSISPLRAPTAGRPEEAVVMAPDVWKDFVSRFHEATKIGAAHGLTVSIHPHAGGFLDFEAETERLLAEIGPEELKLCLDTGHAVYAGVDPVAMLRRHIDRAPYLHFKDIDPAVKAASVAKRQDFYDACGDGIFCNLGQGAVDFAGVKALLEEVDFRGWCAVEQDCDPTKPGSPLDDAKANRSFLASAGF